MKKYILSLLTFFCAATVFGQSVNRPTENNQFKPLSKVKADEHGIITEQPDGDYRIYVRNGRATYASIMDLFIDESQAGIVEELVFSDDGKKVWFKNILSHATTYTWVEGDIDGNTITVPLGQMVYWFEGKNYGLRLARVKVNGALNEYTVDTKGKVTFTIEGDKLILNGTSGNEAETVYDGLGLVYTNDYDGEWSYYLDYETVLTYVDEMPVTPPAGLETETYSMENQTYGHLMRVGFYGPDVYMQNVTESKLTNSWMKGTREGNKVIFPAQVAGVGGSFIYYFCGINGERVEDGYGGYTWNYEWPAGDLVFDYDEETGTLISDQTLLLTTSLEANDGRGEIFHMPRLSPYEEYAGTPRDPKVTAYVPYGNVLSIFMFEVPLRDTEGHFMDPSKLSWQLYVDDDEPYTLYRDEYKYLPEDIDEVPYLYATATENEYYSRSNIYEKAYGIYIYQFGFDRFGIQSIYRGGGEEHRSNISYWNFNETDGISFSSSPKGEESHAYDLSGRKIVNSKWSNGTLSKGIYIVNGKKVVIK